MCGGIYLHICTPSLQMCVRWVHVCVRIFTYMYAKSTWVCTCICIYAHVRINTCIHVCFDMYTCLFLYMCVREYICMWKDTVGAYRCSVCISKYVFTYLGLYVCVYVCTSIHICMKRHRVCMQSVCIQIQAYMSVFVSCLPVWFVCVCRYIHIYMYVRKTPWAHTDTLCAHRNTCIIRICVCACVCMYTHVYIYIWKDTVCAYEFTYVCVYTAYMHVDFTCGCVGL